MPTISHFALTRQSGAKLTPLEVLADFANATKGWVYLDEASEHYAEQKGQAGLVLRYWHEETPVHVDFAFAAEADDADEVGLVILDAPDAETPLSTKQRTTLIEILLDALRDYLDTRPDHVSLHVEQDTSS